MKASLFIGCVTSLVIASSPVFAEYTFIKNLPWGDSAVTGTLGGGGSGGGGGGSGGGGSGGSGTYADGDTGDSINSIPINSTSFFFSGAETGFSGITYSLSEPTSISPGRSIDTNANGSYPISGGPDGTFSSTIEPTWGGESEPRVWTNSSSTNLRVEIGIVDISSVPEGAYSLALRVEQMDADGVVQSDATPSSPGADYRQIDFAVSGDVLTIDEAASFDMGANEGPTPGIISFRVTPIGFLMSGGTVSGMPSSVTLGVQRTRIIQF